ncbi:MAG TPA: hypothetical protein VNH18_14705 [Bryobacteraceae bacterium]|nr:hypothetical protein [Blastocatellia bacterium]HXJ40529.1 hypothetical protein [Bryobacteraceae bacterium]
MKLFVSPHNDDAVLFGAFTLLREKPTVLTVFDSYRQVNRGFPQCDIMTRRREDMAAMEILGCPIQFGCVADDVALNLIEHQVHEALLRLRRVEEVWLPASESGGNLQHNIVSEIGREVFGGAVIHSYLTYTSFGKSMGGTLVSCNGAMALKKLQALACYRTQLEIDELGCWPHFLRDQNEYSA